MTNGSNIRRLGEVILDMKDGGTPSRQRPEYFAGDICWCVVKDIKPLILDTAEKLTEAGLDNCSAKVWPVDSVIVSLGATIGQVGLAKVPTATKQGISGIVVNKRLVTPEYLVHVLNDKREYIQAIATGATIKEVRPTKLKEALAFPVPPIPEQQRIVGILDEAFEAIRTATANAAKNLQNASALFESHLQSIFVRRGDMWDRATLATLLERGWIESHLDGNHGSDYPRKEEFIGDGVPYISANCVDDDRVDMSRAKYLSPSRAALLRKGLAKDRDVLFAHNATVGPVAILRTDEEKVILGTSLTYYRCNPKHILPEYLAHFMRSFRFKTQYLQVMRQSTRNQVPITKQREFWHVIPPLEEQKEIVIALDGLFENGQRLASLYEQKLAGLQALKRSLLHQAFSGQL